MKIFLYIIGFILILNIVLCLLVISIHFALFLDDKLYDLKIKRRKEKDK